MTVTGRFRPVYGQQKSPTYARWRRGLRGLIHLGIRGSGLEGQAKRKSDTKSRPTLDSLDRSVDFPASRARASVWLRSYRCVGHIASRSSRDNSASLQAESARLNERIELPFCWGLRPGLRTASRVARVGPTTPKRAERLFDASVDPTDARKATVRRFGRSDSRSDRSAQELPPDCRVKHFAMH